MSQPQTRVQKLSGVVLAAAVSVVLPLAVPAQAGELTVNGWHEFVNLGGDPLSGGPGVYEPGYGGELLAFGGNYQGKLMLRARDRSFNWSPWGLMDNLGLRDSPAAVEAPDDSPAELEVYFRSSVDNSVRVQPVGNVRGKWGPVYPGGVGNPQGNVTSSPAAIKLAPNRTDLFARGTNGQLQHTWRDQGQWASWEELGGLELVGAPTAVSWQQGHRIDIFATGTDGNLWHRWWTSSGGWSGWENLGGTLTSGPSALMFSNSRMDVFAKGGSDQLVHKFWDAGSGWSGWEALGGDFRYAPSVNKLPHSGINVLVTGKSTQLEHNWWG